MILDPIITASQFAFLQRGVSVSTRREFTPAQLAAYRFRLTVTASYGVTMGVYYGRTVADLEDYASPYRMADSSVSTIIDCIVQD